MLPAIDAAGGVAFARFFVGLGGSRRVDVNLHLARSRDIDIEVLLADDSAAVEGVVEPEVGGEGVMGDGGDNAVFEEVAGGQAEDADGFDADVVIGGSVYDGGIGIVGDGAGKNIDGAAAGVGDADEREIDGFEGAVVVEIEAGELADAELTVDFDAGVDFLAGVAICFKADFGFEEFDLSGVLRRGLLVG